MQLRMNQLCVCDGNEIKTLIKQFLHQNPNIPYSYSYILNSISSSTTSNNNSTFLLNRLLQFSSRHGPISLAVSLFSSIPSPNLHSFTFLFSAAASFRCPLLGCSLHSLFLKSGFPFDPFVTTSILHMYSQSGLFHSAVQLFDEIPHPDIPAYNTILSGFAKNNELFNAQKLFDRMLVRNVITWTTMISGYAHNGRYEEAIELFLRMWSERKVEPNEVTVASVLPACGHVGVMELGERIEGYAREKGMVPGNAYVGNALVEMYGKCGSIEKARRVFEEMGGRRNLCTWNSMIMGLALHGRTEETLRLFNEMKVWLFFPSIKIHGSWWKLIKDPNYKFLFSVVE